MRFGAPAFLWLLLLAPLLSLLLAWSWASRRRALARFSRWPLGERLVAGITPGRQLLKSALLVLGLVSLALALARPQFGVRTTMAPQRGIDLVVALDVSRSMLAEDARPNRYAHAVLQIRELLDRLPGNRVGLVLFAGQAFVQCPLTLDYGAVGMFLEIAGPGAVSVEGTALGDALRVAGRCFDPDDRQHKVIVVFSDGENHLGNPVAEAERLAGEGVRIFTVGVGSAAGELIPDRSESGAMSFHRDASGSPVTSRLDERTLQSVALAGDGSYHRSSLGGDELQQLADQVAQIDRKGLGSHQFTQYEERYQIPGAIGLVCFLLEALLGDGRPRSAEWRGRFA